MLATATAQSDTPNQGPASPPQVRVEYANVEDFLVDYTSNETIGGMFIKTDPAPGRTADHGCFGGGSVDLAARGGRSHESGHGRSFRGPVEHRQGHCGRAALVLAMSAVRLHQTGRGDPA